MRRPTFRGRYRTSFRRRVYLNERGIRIIDNRLVSQVWVKNCSSQDSVSVKTRVDKGRSSYLSTEEQRCTSGPTRGWCRNPQFRPLTLHPGQELYVVPIIEPLITRKDYTSFSNKVDVWLFLCPRSPSVRYNGGGQNGHTTPV